MLRLNTSRCLWTWLYVERPGKKEAKALVTVIYFKAKGNREVTIQKDPCSSFMIRMISKKAILT